MSKPSEKREFSTKVSKDLKEGGGITLDEMKEKDKNVKEGTQMDKKREEIIDGRVIHPVKVGATKENPRDTKQRSGDDKTTLGEVPFDQTERRERSVKHTTGTTEEGKGKISQKIIKTQTTHSEGSEGKYSFLTAYSMFVWFRIQLKEMENWNERNKVLKM